MMPKLTAVFAKAMLNKPAKMRFSFHPTMFAAASDDRLRNYLHFELGGKLPKSPARQQVEVPIMSHHVQAGIPPFICRPARTSAEYALIASKVSLATFT